MAGMKWDSLRESVSIKKPRGKHQKPLERTTSGLKPPWWKMIGMKWDIQRESQSIEKPCGKHRKLLERTTSGLLPSWWKMAGVKWDSLWDSESIEKPRRLPWQPLFPFWQFFIFIFKSKRNKNSFSAIFCGSFFILIPFLFKYNLTHIRNPAGGTYILFLSTRALSSPSSPCPSSCSSLSYNIFLFYCSITLRVCPRLFMISTVSKTSSSILTLRMRVSVNLFKKYHSF